MEGAGSGLRGVRMGSALTGPEFPTICHKNRIRFQVMVQRTTGEATVPGEYECHLLPPRPSDKETSLCAR